MLECKPHISIFHKSRAMLGEGLLVQPDALYWLDIINHILNIKNFSGNILKKINLPEQASAIWKVQLDLLYLASESGLCTLNLKTKEWTVIFPLKEQNELFRANDGGEIFGGQYLFGTMQKQPTYLAGSLYLTDGIEIKEVFKGIGIPNSFIKLSNTELLISDSFCKKVYNFKFCPVSHHLLSQDLWLDLQGVNYTPDGGCIDNAGLDQTINLV